MKNNALAAIAAAIVLAAGPTANAGDFSPIPEPLPPPQELLGGEGYYNPYSSQPPMGNGPVHPAQPPNFSPPQPRAGTVYAAPPGFTISPPMASMPDDYFNLPLLDEGIPGVLLPELDDNFYDPGMNASGAAVAAGTGTGMDDARPVGRRFQPGLNQRQLDPFFDYAKTFEKDALAAKKAENEASYQDNLKKAVDAYMEIIAMADAGNEAREEAWYGVARCEYRRENWWKSFDAIERSFPKNFNRAEVEGRIKLEMFIGERLWRQGYGPVQGAEKDGTTQNGYQAAARVYAAVIFNQPTAKDAPVALLRRGDAAAMENDWKEAAKFYRTVVQYYPESEAAMQARSSLTESVHRQDWPAGLPEAARSDLSNIMSEVENTERKLSPAAEERRQRAVMLANDLEAGEKLSQAKNYLKNIKRKKSKDAAVFLLGDIISRYPTTLQAQEAAQILQGLGINPPMVLSDGGHYPLPGSWYGEDSQRYPAGSVQLARQPVPTMPPPNGNPYAQPDPRFPPAAGSVQVALPEQRLNYSPVGPQTGQYPGQPGQPPGQPVVQGQPPQQAPLYRPTPGSGYSPSLAPLELNVPGVVPEY